MGYQIALRRGAVKAAEQLGEIDGFDPIVLRIGGYDEDAEPIGRYLLLPAEQVERLHGEAESRDGDLDRAIAAVRSVAVARSRRNAQRSQLRRSRAIVRPRWRLHSQATPRGRRGAS